MAALGLVGLLLLGVTAGAAAPLHLGADFSLTAETPIEEIVAHPEAFHNRQVRTRGIIASVCNEEGCFIEVVPQGGGGGIVANFPGLVHTFPTDCAGREAVVEGLLYRKIYHSARVSHWQHHSYHTGQTIPDYSMILRMEVQAAALDDRRQPLPAVTPPEPVAPSRVDLDREEFEDEGFGIGKKHLDAGVAWRRPAAQKARTLVVTVNGAVVVTRQDGEVVRLNPGDMAYIPAATAYQLLAEGASGADVLVIYANVPERQPPHTH